MSVCYNYKQNCYRQLCDSLMDMKHQQTARKTQIIKVPDSSWSPSLNLVNDYRFQDAQNIGIKSFVCIFSYALAYVDGNAFIPNDVSRLAANRYSKFPRMTVGCQRLMDVKDTNFCMQNLLRRYCGIGR